MTSPPWPEDTRLSPYDGGGVPVSPDRAYRGMPEDVALAAAVCDALIWGRDSWPADVQAYQDAPPPILMSSDNERIMAEHGWRDAEDIYEAAGVTEKQRQAVSLYLLGWEGPAIADEMRTSRWNANSHVRRGLDNLHRLVGHRKGVVSEGAPWVPQITYTRPKPPYLVLTDRQMRRRQEREIAAGAEFEAIPSAGREKDGRRLAR